MSVMLLADEAPILQRRIGFIMYEYKLRLEKMQAEWEAVRLIQESNLRDKQKLAAPQRQEQAAFGACQSRGRQKRSQS
jgi:hypothetical protein